MAGQVPALRRLEHAAGTRADGNLAIRFTAWAAPQLVATLSEIVAADVARTPTGQDELDRVLGGGIVGGGVVLIGGDPGIGRARCCCRRWIRCRGR